MNSKLLGATLIITGITLGASVMTLPIVTADLGFLLSAAIFVAVWALLAYSALLMVEVNLWLPEQSNIISMAQLCLGRGAQIVAWVCYLLLLYSLCATYLESATDLTLNAILDYTNISLPHWSLLLMYCVIVAAIIYCGLKYIDYLNRIFMIGLFLALAAIIVGVAPNVSDLTLLPDQSQHFIPLLPSIVAAFGYQAIIPVLRDYLNSDMKQLRQAIIVGSILALVFYLVWQVVVMMSLSRGILHDIASTESPLEALTTSITFVAQISWLDEVFRWMAFFAIITSLFALSYSLVNFLLDGFRSLQWRINRLGAILIVFVPIFIFMSLFFQNVTLILDYGGLLTVLLFVLLPAAMIWSGRYFKNMAFGYRVDGGKIMLILSILFSLLIIYAVLFC